MNPGSDPGGQGNNPIGQILASSITALIMAGIMVAIFSLVPQHEPKLRPEGPKNPAVRDGFWEETDFLGLIETQWTMRDGLADGPALQYHSNGSLFRAMNYRAGKLDGPVLEFDEKTPFRARPIRGRLATTRELAGAVGKLRKKVEYRNGIPAGDSDDKLFQKTKEDAWTPGR